MNNKPVKVYKYNKFDIIATYKPVVMYKASILLDKIDNLFVNH